MTDPDRLAAILTNMAASRRSLRPPYITSEDADWLVAQLKEWRLAADERGREVDRLRDLLAQRDALLARLEWAGTEVDWDEPDAWAVCPACGAMRGHIHDVPGPHDPGCELAAVLDPERETTRPGPPKETEAGR